MTFVILQGSALDVLRTIPSNLIQTCVTSPPYFGLRDYGTASWEGGLSECDHRAPDEAGQTDKPTAGQREHAGRFAGSNCHRCGAKRIDSQIGLEATPQFYVDSLVAVFREVRRTLRDDGTLWLNLGDSYNAHPGQRKTTDKVGAKQETNAGSNTLGSRSVDGMKAKDLIGIPWRVAFALQADGWYLRQDIIWAKPNPMPESVRDRCTKAHEYIFLLSKSEKYYFDADAIKETAVGFTEHDLTGNGYAAPGQTPQNGNRRKGNARSFRGGGAYTQGQTFDNSAVVERESTGNVVNLSGKRNKRSVWTVSPKPFKEAHFATFPPDLIRPCILAGCPPNKLVLDPFGGAGTTALVSEQEGRPLDLHRAQPGVRRDGQAQVGTGPIYPTSGKAPCAPDLRLLVSATNRGRSQMTRRTPPKAHSPAKLPWKVGDWVVFDLDIGQIREIRDAASVSFSDGFCETSGNLFDRFRKLDLRSKHIVETFDIYYGRLKEIDGNAGFNYPDIHQYFSNLALQSIDRDGDEPYTKAQQFVASARDYVPVIDGIRLFRPR